MKHIHTKLNLSLISIILFGMASYISASPYKGDLIKKNPTVHVNTKITTITNWEKNSGIQVLSIRQTAAGYMLDFRYKVLDPEKAAIFMNKNKKPLLKVLKNGLKLQIPVTAKIGPLRQSAKLAKKGKNYFMFFGNPSHMVVAGDKVQIQIGNMKSKELTVE